MSSSQIQNSASTKRIKSIRRRLASRVIHKKIGVCFWHDLILFVLIMCTWFAAAEYAATGIVNLQDRSHYITYEDTRENTLGERLNQIDKEIKANNLRSNKDVYKNGNEFFNEINTTLNNSLKFIVTDIETNKVLAVVYFYSFMCKALIFTGCIYLFQVCVHWLSYPGENARVKRVLSPLNELAQKADEIARFDFSEDKYQLIEEKITSIEPDDEKKISLGDEDLLGIENAMNSLISRIRESNRQQARFVNDASHELRTPIAVIQGYANMLARWGREDEKVLDESITAIQNESDNMKRLVEQLLFLARGDAGRTVLNKTDVNLNLLMQEVYEESLMIDENHIYKFKCPEGDVIVSADEGLLKQALRILVDNAAKYTNAKDEIILSVGLSDNNEAYLQVQDSGIGMKQVDVEHMFERFYRADEARSFNGTGLGLSIAKWIVDKHEGHFEIISREELGTRIGIYLGKR